MAVLKDSLFTPNLVRDWEDPEKGYFAFRCYVAHQLGQLGLPDKENRLELLDDFFHRYRERYVFIVKGSPPSKEWLNKLTTLASDYRSGGGEFSGLDGRRIRGYHDVTSIEDSVLRLMSIYFERKQLTRNHIKTLQEKTKNGKAALRWAQTAGVGLECLDELKTALEEQEFTLHVKSELYEGRYGYVVAAGQGAARVIEASPTTLKKGRWKGEQKSSERTIVNKLVHWLTIMGEQTVTEAEAEVASLLYAIGYCGRIDPIEYVHKLRFSR